MNGRPITDYDKLACIDRELKLRQIVYPNRVRQGLMTRAMAEREIMVMRAIYDEYRDRLYPSLFDEDRRTPNAK